jgi:hypothetical protein
MNLIDIVDTLSNAIPRTPARAILHMGDGKGADGLTYVIPSVLTYAGLCAAQGATAGYVTLTTTGSATKAIAAGVITAVAPPIIWGGKVTYDFFHS